jgi:hypothetical protein
MLVMILTAVFFFLPLPLGVLGHEGGTILVVPNGLRLPAFRPSPGMQATAPDSGGAAETVPEAWRHVSVAPVVGSVPLIGVRCRVSARGP